MLNTGLLMSASVVVLTFDDLVPYSQVGQNQNYANLGVHFTLTDHEVQVGLDNGDPYDWGLNGTNGPYFDAFNGWPSYAMTITFDAPLLSFSVDAARSNGSQVGDAVLVSAFNGLIPLGSVNIPFGLVNTWSTATLDFNGAVFDKVTIEGTGAGYHPYGIDNIVFTRAPVTLPEPGAVWLTAAGGSLLLLRRRLRRSA
ncbi:MAG: hypothetical protein LAP87_05825 [Acidobacteriia bacterium]|nr:hypothetical protein [Terriglobia bacterium]